DFLNGLTFLLRFLADPPPPSKVTPLMEMGADLFEAIGCEFCHYKGYTAVSTHPARNGKPVPLYSDLLLHDIGTGDGIVQGDAQGNEFRTPPLWVVRGVHPYLHDGRARNPLQAIDAHKGQAIASRDAFFALSSLQ